MFKMIRQLFLLLSKSQVRQFYVLQVLVVLMAFTELLGIASIAPFMALVGDISILERNEFFSKIYQISNVSNPSDFLFYVGLAVLFTLGFSTLISMYTIWKLSLYANKVGTELADRLYVHYMRQDWLFHASGSSSHLVKQVSTEALRLTDYILQPLMMMNARLVLAIFISIGILFYDPLTAISGLLLFICSYFLLYKIVRKQLDKNGLEVSKSSTERFRLMSEGFGGIRDVLLLNRHHDFVKRFKKKGEDFAYARGTNSAISIVPRYFMEFIAFGVMIGLVLLLIKLHEGALGLVLPIIAVYSLAAFKLLPSLQQVYSSVAQIKGNIAAFEAIKDDLAQALNSQSDSVKNMQDSVENVVSKDHFSLKQQISLDNITFSYPNKARPAVNGLSMIIPANSVVGLVGASGSGKSTVIDLLLNLLTPQQGELCIDGIHIGTHNKRSWQDIIGFVPQSIFLSEGTIAENIGFGLHTTDISLDQVQKAIKLAHLTEVIEQLPDGINTKVGERGVQLSGGQRQRVGIARALYNDADVLIFDEATSALDGITEQIIMEAIHEFNGEKTIIMVAHRLKTVEKCDIIYLMEQGRVIAQGTYEELVEGNAQFKEMTKYS
jgi:ABC-type multidrug transport system fused ATPase/permease subunit